MLQIIYFIHVWFTGTCVQSSSLAQQLAEGQAVSSEIEQVKALLESVTQEKQRLEEEVTALGTKHEEASLLSKQLSLEKEGLTTKLTEVEDALELSKSELSSLQADLATVTSERNTQKITTEAVSVCRVT